MKKSEFQDLLIKIFDHVNILSDTKGAEYTIGNDNQFHNFETVGNFIGLSREKILGVYLYKHISGVFNYIKTKETYSEPIRGRILDAILYLCLLYGMIDEEDDIRSVK